jgi:hypothetical protein
MNNNENLHQEQFQPLEEFILNNWESFAIFSEFINQEEHVFFEGEGRIYLSTKLNQITTQDIFYLFGINGKLYATSVKEHRQSTIPYFDGIYELDLSFLNSSILKDAYLLNYKSQYKKLAIKVEIDLKSYNYHDEEKLLFSNKDKVDLLYSQQLILNNEQSILKVQTYPSLKHVVQWTRMVEQVNERTRQFIEQRNKIQ